ncbi:Helitron helicase [Phytophthora megakarya]|uniref:Helitron helicase n=1 Tax=Phytophthora megakarya TaxID=4795 RepID=A0A225UNZ3_9STRA|nr:Helitron helicase [Phytophthora megakarya]
MIRNLNSDAGLCNGTRLRVVSLRERSIEATIMSGPFKGKTAIKIAVDPSAIDENGNIHTKNIVYREIFDL